MFGTLLYRCSIYWLLLQSLPAVAQQAQPGSHLGHDRANPQSTDVLHHGPYQIFACGGNASIVANALDSLWTDLITAIDFSKSDSTNPAFDAFFKTNISAPIITAILTNASRGDPITTWTSQIPHTPVLTCAFEPGVTVHVNQRTLDLYDICRDPLPAPTAFAMKSNHWIVLCPEFFTSVIPATPPWQLNPPSAPTKYCRKKDRVARTVGALLIDYRPSVLLHELVHQYLEALGLVSREVRETYAFDGALSLSAADSLVNPANYQFYVAGESHCIHFVLARACDYSRQGKGLTLHSVCIALAGGCTDFQIQRPLQVIVCEGRCLSSGGEYNSTASDGIVLDAAGYLTQ